MYIPRCKEINVPRENYGKREPDDAFSFQKTTLQSLFIRRHFTRCPRPVQVLADLHRANGNLFVRFPGRDSATLWPQRNWTRFAEKRKGEKKEIVFDDVTGRNGVIKATGIAIDVGPREIHAVFAASFNACSVNLLEESFGDKSWRYAFRDLWRNFFFTEIFSNLIARTASYLDFWYFSNDNLVINSFSYWFIELWDE